MRVCVIHENFLTRVKFTYINFPVIYFATKFVSTVKQTESTLMLWIYCLYVRAIINESESGTAIT